MPSKRMPSKWSPTRTWVMGLLSALILIVAASLSKCMGRVALDHREEFRTASMVYEGKVHDLNNKGQPLTPGELRPEMDALKIACEHLEEKFPRLRLEIQSVASDMSPWEAEIGRGRPSEFDKRAISFKTHRDAVLNLTADR
jgi:hypothetical protein